MADVELMIPAEARTEPVLRNAVPAMEIFAMGGSVPRRGMSVCITLCGVFTAAVLAGAMIVTGCGLVRFGS
ncbi:MAG: hypothetical protein ABSF12_05450 [Bryobacteraceae bacterium]|jgi:hypothetical protein